MSWIVWLVIAAACLAIEVITTDFTFLMLAGGALVATGAAAGTDNIWIQIAVFGVVAILLLVLVRPWAKNRFNVRGSRVGSAQVLIGKKAVAVTDVDESAGRVKIVGDVWSARSASGFIPQGSDVTVVELEGVTAIVVPAVVPENTQVQG
ncbi:MAG: NfeD family protein [Actinomycetaceae bacterium]|nr:NfeD family protein [Actinomycetaceae bacterium]